MGNELSHKGYKGTCAVSVEDGCLHGRIQDIDDLITYEGNTVPELAAAFSAAVENYLAHCASIGKTPSKPYSGTFNVRVGPYLHKAAAQHARAHGKKLNELVCTALADAITKQQHPTLIRHEVTVNHNITRYEQQVEVPFATEDDSAWQQPSPKKPHLRLNS